MRAPASAHEAGEAGETLVELLVTVVILGIATTGLSAALLATGEATTMQRQQVLAQNALRSWAEQVDTQPYTSCATAADFDPPDPALPSALTASVTDVQYWNRTAFVASCTVDSGIQKVILTITVANGLSAPLVRSLAVVVREPCVAAC